MARPLRISYAGALYHIISRGNEAREIFIDKRDRGRFLQYLREIILDYPWSSYRYFITQINTPDFLCTDFILSVFSEDLEKARGLYREFVEKTRKEKKDLDSIIKELEDLLNVEV